MFQIRATRVAPTGYADRDERRDTYGAALAQFEELLEAACKVGPHTRALPLFYALSQAGRAIATTRLEGQWRLQGHGVGCPHLSTEPILQTEVHPAKPAKPGKRPDAFHGVAAATSSGAITEPATIGALWAALPTACDLLDDVPEAADFARPFIAELDQPNDPKGLPRWDRIACSLVIDAGETFESFSAKLNRYPYGDQLRHEVPQSGRLSVQYTPHGYGARVVWPVDGPADQDAYWALVETITPLDPLSGLRWWRPRIDETAMNDLMTWWALLFGLSMFTRYEPAEWTAALDLDRSSTAAPLRRLLDLAVEAIPALVLQTLDPWYFITPPRLNRV